MIPVYQTEFGHQGNCFSACLASIFELPLETIPNFHTLASDNKEWHAAVRKWLSQYGFSYLSLNLKDADDEELQALLPGWHIVCGVSARHPDGDVHHATVWRDGKFVHDPHPEGNGLIEVLAADMLFPLDPSRFKGA